MPDLLQCIFRNTRGERFTSPRYLMVFVSTSDSAKDHVRLRLSPVLGRRRMGPFNEGTVKRHYSVPDGVSSCRFKAFSSLFLQS